ncbi:MAG: hypothetical protein CO099_09030 [Bdellovibrio sp. CG_4_9_14_3_um_filter_39_7]|nr:MAG: hypothetical protein CO099_09030 [Bdellovibrio sp. CG_4_9_14_3_um_filter_39_7]
MWGIVRKYDHAGARDYIWGKTIQKLAEKLAYMILVKPHEVAVVRMFGLKELRREGLKGWLRGPFDWTRDSEVVEKVNTALMNHDGVAKAIRDEGQSQTRELRRLKAKFWAARNMAEAIGIKILGFGDYVFCRKAHDLIPTWIPFERGELGYFSRFAIHASWAINDHNRKVGITCKNLMGNAGAPLVAYMVAQGISLIETTIGQHEAAIPLIDNIEKAFNERNMFLAHLKVLCRKGQFQQVVEVSPHFFAPIDEQVTNGRGGDERSEGFFRSSVDCISGAYIGFERSDERPWGYPCSGKYWSQIFSDTWWRKDNVRRAVLREVFGEDVFNQSR